MQIRTLGIPAAAAASLLLAGGNASAQQKGPDAGYAFPAACVAGGTTEVTLGGYEWTPDSQILPHHPGVRIDPIAPLGPVVVQPPPYWFGPKSYNGAAPQPREWRVRVTAAADVEPGPVRWQVANANGGSSTGILWISRAPDVLERRLRDLPMRLESIPTAVSGRLSRIEEVDRYRFQAASDGVLALQVAARSLGSDFNATLQVRDSAGRLLLDEADSAGNDLASRLSVRKGESYEVAVSDLDFRGDFAYAYRLLIAPSSPEAPTANRFILRAGDRPLEHRFTGHKGENLRLAANSVGRIAGWDLSMKLRGPDGKELVQNDDLPGGTDPGIETTLPQDGEYVVVIDGVSPPAAPPQPFDLKLVRLSPGFELRGPQKLDLLQGGAASLKLTARRLAGFEGPIRVTATGLPVGCTLPAVIEIPAGKSDVTVPISHTASAGTSAALTRWVGTAEQQGHSLRAPCLAPVSDDLTGAGQALTDQVLVTVTLKAPFKISQPDKEGGRRVPRGAEFPADVVIERDPGYLGEVVLQMASKQDRHRQGISGPEFPVPAGAARVEYPVYWPEWLETSRTSRMVLVGVGRVRDGAGRERQVVSTLDGRITVWIEGALLKLEPVSRELKLPSDGVVTVELEVLRNPRINGDLELSASLDEGYSGTASTSLVRIPAGESRVRTTVRLSGLAAEDRQIPLVLRAQTRLDGKWRVQSEARLLLMR